MQASNTETLKLESSMSFLMIGLYLLLKDGDFCNAKRAPVPGFADQ